jgi:lysophospholipase L1-like esterase
MTSALSWLARLLSFAGLLVAAALSASAQDQTERPIGVVDDPCPEPTWTSGPPPLQSDWGWLCRYRDDNAALVGAPAPRVVFMGDSITEFWSRFDPDLFGEGVINRGISGQTSPQMLLRFYSDVVALRPAAVHIMAGTNDLAGNTGPSRPEDFKNNIRAMADLAEANGIAVILASIPPAAAFPWRSEVEPAPIIAALNAWLESYAAERGLVFVDYHAAMAGPAGELRSELSGDGVHPDAEGYAVMRPLTIGALAAVGVAIEE